MGISNYDKALQQAQQLFLGYDQSAMIEKFHLEHDEAYLYLPFIARQYRICRKTGLVQWLDDCGNVQNANYNEGMSIYDVLCYSKSGCHLSGQFAPVNSVAKNYHTSGLGESLFDTRAEVFEKDPRRFEEICKKLGGVQEGKGDVAYRLPVFPFLPVRVQLWLADEEFPASFQILWDTNALDFVHYETTYYIAGHLLSRLRELMEQT